LPRAASEPKPIIPSLPRAEIGLPKVLNDQRKPTVNRHKTAIRRGDASAPIKCGLRDGLVDATTTVFDYGCGHGEDLRILAGQGIECSGWDPAFRPVEPLRPADVVNVGYVVNVIEEPSERAGTLRRAWELCQQALIVAAQIVVLGRGNNQVEFGDGVLTRRGTFQKFYTQAELREYIETVLETDAIPAAPGIFYVFKDEAVRQQFLANRYRRRPAGPRKRISELRFEQHRELLEPLMEHVETLGRLPESDEFDLSGEVVEAFGSLKRAFALIRRVVGIEPFGAAANERRQDLLVYLALGRFRKRPRIRQLPLSLQRDIRAFFGSYKRACAEADELLFRAGEADSIDQACRQSAVGKLLPNALYVHRSALPSLDPLLRVYEGCSRAFLGEVDGVNIIKLHRFSGKISYLVYPDFETNPHPALLRSIKLSLRDQSVDGYDYSQSENPPILHRKETFLEPSHPLYEKFARLTCQQEKHGILDDSRSIGTKAAWEERLQKAGFQLRGHRLVRRGSRST